MLFLAVPLLTDFDAGYQQCSNKEIKLDIELYDFKEHIDSIEWIHSLPKGLISQKIDIRYSEVTITKLEDGYQIYIGPKDPDSAGDGILITLDKNYKLQDYLIERLEPPPF